MPPRIDLTALPPFEGIPGGPINNLPKPQLFSIARELGMTLPAKDTDITVKDLKSNIQTALAKVPNDTRFHEFSVHRPATTGGAALKNTAHKDKQDRIAENEKPDVVPSGAHKKLLQGGVKSDPSPRYNHLNNPDARHKEDGNSGEDNDDKSSLLSSVMSDVEEVPKPPIKKAEPKRTENNNPNKPPSKIVPTTLSFYNPLGPNEDGAGLLIAVEFQGIQGSKVWVDTAGLQLVKGGDGGIYVSLRALIPKALAQLSPSKDPAYPLRKLYLLSDLSSTSLGTIEDHTSRDGKIPAFLELPQADYYHLERQFTHFICRIIWKDGDVAPAIHSKPVQPLILPGSAAPSTLIRPQDKPWEMAKERPKTSQKRVKGKKRFIPGQADDSDSEDWPDNQTDTGFLSYLNKVAGGRPNGYKKSLDTMGERLEHWNDIKRAVKLCDEKFTPGNPYRIGADVKDDSVEAYRQYARRPFTKKNLYTALGVGTSTISSDKSFIEHKALPYDPLAVRWVQGDPTLDATTKAQFDLMSSKEWSNHLEEAKQDKLEADEEAAQKASKGKGKEKAARKRSHCSVASGSSSDYGHSSEAEKLRERLQQIESAAGKTRKRSRKAAVDSDNLDSSDS
ncbi:hypothetical protein R3P38DRAFT_3623362 [Favolaschia claudopus]|uniref:Uncharacterized protein n=1 Tax=Favolaschia claudopus TaxID=2862362 RepID=A0AAW0A1J4_9AGAR